MVVDYTALQYITVESAHKPEPVPGISGCASSRNGAVRFGFAHFTFLCILCLMKLNQKYASADNSIME